MEARQSLEAAENAGVPMESLALYGRWWQLENWLRLLAYTTLRAAYGEAWEGELEKRAVSRALKDLLHAHIMSPDQANTLAYLDVTDLFELIDSNWTLFEQFLLPQSIWQGRIIELNSIRRSIAHCRRPHRDDRSRVEQTLRDLEPGFWSALEGQAAGPVDLTLSDPVVDDWNKGQLQYLRNSVARRYRYIDVELGLARQPWANYDGNRPATGTPGLLWALDISGSGERWIEPTAYWTQLNPKTQNTLVHVFMSTSFGVRVTFAAVDRANLVIDAMIDCIEAFMQASWHVSRVSTARAESGRVISMHDIHESWWKNCSRFQTERGTAQYSSPDDGLGRAATHERSVGFEVRVSPAIFNIYLSLARCGICSEVSR